MDRRRIALSAFALATLFYLFMDRGNESASSPHGESKPQEQDNRGSPASPSRDLAAAAPTASLPDAKQVPTATDPKTALGILQDDLLAQEKCYENRRCALPNSDPRAYDLAVGRELAEKLRKIRNFAGANSLTGAPELTSIALHALANPDGHVKAAALEILREQPPSETVLNALLDHVLRAHDSELLPAALAELSRYGDTASRESIDKVFREVLSTGSHFVSLRLAESLFPFLQPANIRFYQQVWQDLLPSNPVRKTLAQQIQVFLAQQSGG